MSANKSLLKIFTRDVMLFHYLVKRLPCHSDIFRAFLNVAAVTRERGGYEIFFEARKHLRLGILEKP